MTCLTLLLLSCFAGLLAWSATTFAAIIVPFVLLSLGRETLLLVLSVLRSLIVWPCPGVNFTGLCFKVFHWPNFPQLTKVVSLQTNNWSIVVLRSLSRLTLTDLKFYWPRFSSFPLTFSQLTKSFLYRPTIRLSIIMSNFNNWKIKTFPSFWDSGSNNRTRSFQ